MDLKHANVLITGGSEGIGRGLAELFLAAGSRVMITGRDSQKLEKAARELSGLEIFVNDIGIPAQREGLAIYIKSVMPGLNILINNAGIQRRISLAEDDARWAERQAEIDILLSGPIHLNHLLIPVLLSQTQPALIVNVTSGGAYIPQVFAPMYSACKAALHSYTMVLRHSLTKTNCKVAELIPPAVQTGLAGLGMNHGALLNEFGDAVFRELFIEDQPEVGFGPTKDILFEISGKPQQVVFNIMSAKFPVKIY